jgi:hypothetical protein
MVTPRNFHRRIPVKLKVPMIMLLLLTAGTIGTVQANASVPSQTASAGTASSPQPTSPHNTSSENASNDSAAFAAALKSPDWVKTPEGLMWKSCVHALPKGARLDRDTVVLASGVKQAPIGACSHANIPIPGQAATAKVAPAPTPTTSGWLADSWWTAPQWLSGIYSTYTVPKAPAAGGSTDYFFSSLEDPNPGAALSILQPVLTWGGSSWFIQSWYVWANNTKSVTGPAVAVAPGDTIYTGVEAAPCSSGGDCTWDVYAQDSRTGGETTLSINAGQPFTAAQGGVMEVYGVNGCNQLPANGNMDFTSISVYGSSYQHVTPSWSVNHTGNSKGYCGVYVDTSATQTYIPWTP